MKVAVVGATGLSRWRDAESAGRAQLPGHGTPAPFASEKSVGTEIEYQGKKYKVVSMDDAIAARPAVAIFSAGGSVSKEQAPRFAEVGTVVIDNSSAWRMDPTKKLVVPKSTPSSSPKTIKSLPTPTAPPSRWCWPCTSCTKPIRWNALW